MRKPWQPWECADGASSTEIIRERAGKGYVCHPWVLVIGLAMDKFNFTPPPSSLFLISTHSTARAMSPIRVASRCHEWWKRCSSWWCSCCRSAMWSQGRTVLRCRRLAARHPAPPLLFILRGGGGRRAGRQRRGAAHRDERCRGRWDGGVCCWSGHGGAALRQSWWVGRGLAAGGRQEGRTCWRLFASYGRDPSSGGCYVTLLLAIGRERGGEGHNNIVGSWHGWLQRDNCALNLLRRILTIYFCCWMGCLQISLGLLLHLLPLQCRMVLFIADFSRVMTIITPVYRVYGMNQQHPKILIKSNLAPNCIRVLHYFLVLLIVKII